MRDSMVFYKSFADALEVLPPEEYKAVVQAILNYAMDDIEPELEGMPKALFIMAKPTIDSNNKKYEKGKNGGRPSKKPMVSENENFEKPMVSESENHRLLNEKTTVDVDVSVDDTVDVSENVDGDVDGDVKKGKTRKRFSPPTRNEIDTYCKQKGLSIDIDRFIDYYSAQGWKLSNGNHMKDWQATVRNWARDKTRDKTKGARSGTTSNKFNNFEQRKYSAGDYDAIMKAMIERGRK